MARQSPCWRSPLLAFALRLLRLDFQPLWWDEGYSVYFASQDLVTLTLKTAADIHPPLYYYLLHLWIALFGPSDVAVRLLSVFIGTAHRPALLPVARRLVPGGVALLAACSWPSPPSTCTTRRKCACTPWPPCWAWAPSTSPSASSHARQPDRARPGAQPRGERRDWLGYVLFTSLAMYTLYYAAFIPLFQTVFAVLANWRQLPQPCSPGWPPS